MLHRCPLSGLASFTTDWRHVAVPGAHDVALVTEPVAVAEQSGDTDSSATTPLLVAPNTPAARESTATTPSAGKQQSNYAWSLARNFSSQNPTQEPHIP